MPNGEYLLLKNNKYFVFGISDVKRIFVTGSAGFIGFHLVRHLLSEGFIVRGLDGMTPYYDVGLKKARCDILEEIEGFSSSVCMLEDQVELDAAIDEFHPDAIIHLAAQAGVRHSIDNPRQYLNSNVIGTFNIMEAARRVGVRHLMMASSSSVYGANTEQPFSETHKTDTQLSMYAATKKATESMGHAFAHLWSLPTTMFRFFTVYGSWGRPDLAYFKFADAMLAGRTIDIYNNGDMARDFTHVHDLVRGIRLLLDVVPTGPGDAKPIEGDSLSPVAPYRVVNIGNSQKVRLLDFIDAIEQSLGVKAVRNFLPMQPGDVQETWADASLLKALTGYAPQTKLQDGIDEFVEWYRKFYQR